MTLQDWALVLAISSILLNILAEIIKHWRKKNSVNQFYQ